MTNNKKNRAVTQHPVRADGTDFCTDKEKVLRNGKTGRIDGRCGWRAIKKSGMSMEPTPDIIIPLRKTDYFTIILANLEPSAEATSTL